MISLRKMSKIPIDETWTEINTTLPSYNGVAKPFNSGLSTPSGKVLATYNQAGSVHEGIYCSTDKGTTWSLIQQGTWTLAGITTTGRIIAYGYTDQDYSAIIYSDDDGETWTVKPLVIDGNYMTRQSSALYSLKIPYSNVLYGLSFNNSNNTGTIYRSIDDGETWSVILSGNNLHSFYVKHVDDATKVSYLQAQSVYSTDIIIRFSGTGNVILYDVYTQTAHNSNTIENAGSIYSTSTDRLIAVTYSSCDAVIYYSDDFGYTWVKAKQIGASLSYLFVDPNPIYTLCVLDNAQLLVGTNFGLLKSSDNGTTWSLSSTFRNVPGKFIWLPKDNIVIILGYQKDHTGASAVDAIGNDTGKLYYSGGIIPAKNAREKYLDQNGVQEIVTQFKAYCDNLIGGA